MKTTNIPAKNKYPCYN